MIPSEQSGWKGQYNAFMSVIMHDYPYNLVERVDESAVAPVFELVYDDLITQHSKTRNPYYSENGKGRLNLAFLDHFIIICHRFAHALYQQNISRELADAIYYSCRVRTSTDIFYRAEIGDFFLPSHPLGTVIDSHSRYGIGLRLYNGVHIGPYGIDGKKPSEWVHPVFGDGVIIYAKATIYGKTVVGNNVTISSGCTIINETIPNNCIVFGASPDLKAVPNKQNNLGIFDI